MYHAVAVTSPAASPRGGHEPDEGFYYALVFPAAARARAKEPGGPRVSFAAACDLLLAATPADPLGGGAADEQRVLAELRRAWAAKFRAAPPVAGDSVAAPLLRELLRELVLARLEAVEGLQVAAATAPDGRVLVGLRPSAALLAATAERRALPVPVVREAVPAASERHVWGRAAAQEELLRLFLAGDVPLEDARLFDEDEGEDAPAWSRRLHALRRLSAAAKAEGAGDEGEDDGAAPPDVGAVDHLPFAARASLQFLYRQIDGAAAASPFRVVDRIRLTRAVIDAQLDLDALVAAGVLRAHLCLHSHRADAVDTSIDALRTRWGSGRWQWGGRWRLARAWRLPASEPLQHVRNYFGEQIALYFGFASRLVLTLQTLLALALVLALLSWGRRWAAGGPSPSPAPTDRLALLIFAAANCAATRMLERKWALRARALAAAWGTDHSWGPAASPAALRTQFRGPRGRSAVDRRLAALDSPGRRLARRAAAAGALLALLGAVLGLTLRLVSSRRFQAFATASRARVSMANALLAAAARGLGDSALAAAARALAGWEDHATREGRDASLGLQYALSQAVNALGLLGYMALVRSTPDDCGRARAGLSCREQAADLLVVSLALDLALALLRLAIASPSACSSWLLRPGGGAAALDAVRAPLKPAAHDAAAALEAEAALPPYAGVLGAYARLARPWGYVAGFAALAPLPATALAWAAALAHVRLEAFTLTHGTQRPLPEARAAAGRWGPALGLGVLASAALNASLAAQTLASGPSAGDDEAQAAAARLGVLAGFALLWWALGWSDPWDRAVERRLVRAVRRREYLRRSYLSGPSGGGGYRSPVGADVGADADADALGPPAGRVFLNGVFRYLVTGDKREEDAAEELRDQVRGQQRRAVEVETRVAELRARLGSGPTSLGALCVEVLGINALPAGVDAFVELQVVRGRRGGRRGDDEGVGVKAADGAADADGACFNTSVAPRVAGRAPQWREAFELPIASLEHELELRVLDAAATARRPRRGRSRLGVARLAVADVVERCGARPESPAGGSPRAGVASTAAAAAAADGVSMGSYELPLDASEALLAGLAGRHGHPRLALRCGVRLEELGALLVAQRRQQRRLAELRAGEARFLRWEGAPGARPGEE